jgi:hypothetical protein
MRGSVLGGRPPRLAAFTALPQAGNKMETGERAAAGTLPADPK